MHKRGSCITDISLAVHLIASGVGLFNHCTLMSAEQWHNKPLIDIIKLVRAGRVYHTKGVSDSPLCALTEREIDTALVKLCPDRGASYSDEMVALIEECKNDIFFRSVE